jgi:hypothetical protein
MQQDKDNIKAAIARSHEAFYSDRAVTVTARRLMRWIFEEKV